LEGPVKLLDRWHRGRVLSGFDSAQRLDAHASQLGKFSLRQAGGHPVLDKVAGNADSAVFQGRIVPVFVSIRQGRQVSRFGQRRQTVEFRALQNDVLLAIKQILAY